MANAFDQFGANPFAQFGGAAPPQDLAAAPDLPPEGGGAPLSAQYSETIPFEEAKPPAPPEAPWYAKYANAVSGVQSPQQADSQDARVAEPIIAQRAGDVMEQLDPGGALRARLGAPTDFPLPQAFEPNQSDSLPTAALKGAANIPSSLWNFATSPGGAATLGGIGALPAAGRSLVGMGFGAQMGGGAMEDLNAGRKQEGIEKALMAFMATHGAKGELRETKTTPKAIQDEAINERTAPTAEQPPTGEGISAAPRPSDGAPPPDAGLPPNESLRPEIARATISPDEQARQVAESTDATAPGNIAPGQQPPSDIRSAGVGQPESGGVSAGERQAPVSTANDFTEGRREVLGMEPREEVITRSDQSVQDTADAHLRRNPEAGRALVSEIHGKARSIKDWENVVLARHIADVERQHAELIDHVNATKDPAAIEQLHAARDDLYSAYGAAEKTGIEIGRDFRQRGVALAGERYTLPRMQAERRAVKGGKPLDTAQLKQVEDVFKRMQNYDRGEKARVEAIKSGKAKVDLPPRGKGAVAWFERKEAIAKQRIIGRRGRLNVGLDPTALADEIVVGVAHIARGTRDFGAWSSKMLREFGDRVKPYLRELYDKAIEKHDHIVAASEARTRSSKVKAYKTRTTNTSADLREKTIAGDTTKTAAKRSEIEFDPMVQNMRAGLEKARYDYNVMLEKDRLASRPKLKKIVDTLVDLERSIKLTGIQTFGKLGSAGAQRVVQNVAEGAVGKALSFAPVMRKVMRAAPTEGAPTLRSVGAYARGFGQGVKDIPKVISGAIRARDAFEGGATPKPPSVLDIPGRLHGAVKQPFKQAQESAAFENALTTAERRGDSIDKPGVIETAKEQAKESGLRAIFTNDNVLSNAWTHALGWLEGSKKFPTAGYVISKVGRFLLPIVRVPTNIAFEVGTMNVGVASGSWQLLRVMKRGMEKIKPEEADMIARHYKKGLVGAGLFLTGYFNASNFGGFYQPPGEKQIKRNGLEHDTAMVKGLKLSKWMLHSPAALQMQFGATVRKYMDIHKGAPESVMAAAHEIVHEIPFVNEMAEFDNLLKSNWEGQKARGYLAKGSVVPQGVQNIAKWMDDRPRKPRNTLEHIESGVPWLQDRVPLGK